MIPFRVFQVMEAQAPSMAARDRLERAFGVALGAALAMGGSDQPGVKKEIRELLALANPSIPLRDPGR